MLTWMGGYGGDGTFGYQAKPSQDYRAEHRARDKSTDQIFSKNQQRSSEDRRGTDKRNQSTIWKPGNSLKYASKSSSASSNNRQNQQNYKNEPKSSEAKNSNNRSSDPKSHNNNKPSGDANRSNKTKFIQPNKPGSKLVISKIHPQEAASLTLLPRVILKRKEI